MSRLSSVDPAADSGPGADLLNGPLKAKQINIFKGLAAHPPLLQAFLEFAGGVKGGALTPAEHEVVALVMSTKNECRYCAAAHTKVASTVGIDEQSALQIRQGQGGDVKQQALIDFVQAIVDTKGFVSDAQLQAFRDAGWTDQAAIETIGAITVNTFTNYFNHVNDTVVDFAEPAAVGV